jgi:predicted  nucleic acid-binding Zn-ribbon protein
VVFVKLYFGKLSLLGQISSDILTYKNTIKALQNNRTEIQTALDKLQKENVKLKKDIINLDKEYESIQKGTNFDDAISKYRGIK